jgi:hypothetical protein
VTAERARSARGRPWGMGRDDWVVAALAIASQRARPGRRRSRGCGAARRRGRRRRGRPAPSAGRGPPGRARSRAGRLALDALEELRAHQGAVRRPVGPVHRRDRGAGRDGHPLAQAPPRGRARRAPPRPAGRAPGSRRAGRGRPAPRLGGSERWAATRSRSWFEIGFFMGAPPQFYAMGAGARGENWRGV